MGCPAVLYFSQMFIYMAPTGTAVQALDLPDLGLLQTILDMRQLHPDHCHKRSELWSQISLKEERELSPAA